MSQHKRLKSRDLPRHAKKRALERYGVALNDRDLQVLVTQIQSGHAAILEKQSLRVSVFRVKWGDQFLSAAYDKNRKQIVTFLPKNHECT